MGQRCSNCSSSGSSAQDEEMLRLLENAIVAGQGVACSSAADVYDLRKAVDSILETEKMCRLAGERNPTRYAQITIQRAELIKRLEQRMEELKNELTGV